MKANNTSITTLPDHKLITRDLVDYFIRNRNWALGCVYNEWQEVVERHPQITESAHAKELAALAEILVVMIQDTSHRILLSQADLLLAQDSNKNGANMSDLWTRFRTIRKTYQKPPNPSILDSIRNCVLVPDFGKMDTRVDYTYKPDPDLNLRKNTGVSERWDEEYTQAKSVLPKFNEELASAIRRDEMPEGTSHPYHLSCHPPLIHYFKKPLILRQTQSRNNMCRNTLGVGILVPSDLTGLIRR